MAYSNLSELGMALSDLNEDKVEIIIRRSLDAGIAAEDIITGLSDGMTRVGELFRLEEYFLTELIYSGEIFKKAMAILQPFCKISSVNNDSAVVVIGTVQGDIHDLGKNIVASLLECSGFRVVDVGVDVSPQRFVDAVKESGAELLGMSMLLTTAFDAAQETIAAFTKADMRNKVKIMIGGSVTDESVRQHLGADFWGRDATAAVDIARMVYQ
ncbi:MAG TPA: cobalamin-dependent protein [Desulfomonilia bacterium]